ncbi:rolling circle replication-associated protein [Clostridium butyricum]
MQKISKKLHEEYEYEEVYKKSIKETKEDEIENKLRKNRRTRYTYIKKTIVSGSVIECEIYPIWKNGSDVPRTKVGISREAQKNLNDKNAKKKINRLINTNFTEDDLMITLTYKNNYLPNEDEAKRDIQNYINRLKRRRKKDGIEEPLKYLYVIEYENNKKNSKKVRIHHHIIINKMDRNSAEEVWRKGRTDSMRLQLDDDGLSGISKYISKGLCSGRRWSYSKNLKKPTIYRDRTTLSKRKIERVALAENDYKEFFEKEYKKQGYEYYDCKSYYSDMAAGYYLYARLINKKEVQRE